LSIDNGLHAAATPLVNIIRPEPVEIKLLIAAFQALPNGLSKICTFQLPVFFIRFCLQTGSNPESLQGPAFTP